MFNLNRHIAAFLVSGSMAASLIAQSADQPSKDNQNQDSKENQTTKDEIKAAKTLFLVVRAGQLADGSTLTMKELERIFTNSLKETKFKYEKIGVRNLSPTVFNDLNRIMNDGSGNVWRTELDEGLVVTQGMVDDRNLLLIRLPKPTMQVKSVKISTGSDNSIKEYTNTSENENRRVVRIATDTYAMPWELNTVINDIEIELTNEGKKLPKPIKKDLKGLANTQYYAVFIKNYEGNLNSLYKYIQNEEKQGNPITIAEGIQEYTVQLAAMGQESGTSEGTINDRNIWESRLPRLSRGKPSRVWSLFPLTKEQADAEIKKYEGKDPEEIVKEIEKSKKMTAEKLATVGPATEPQWLEMTPDNLGDFKRDIQLEGLDQLIEKYKDGFHRLKVYELEVKDANRKEAIRVKGKMIENEKVASLPGLIGQKVKAADKTGEKK